MSKLTSKSMKVLGRVALIMLLLSAAGEIYSLAYPKEFTSIESLPNEFVVQLRRATLPSLLGPLAVHYWFIAFNPETRKWERWEVWQDAGADATSWGHIRKDLMLPDNNVGGGPYAIEMEWHGAKAQNIYMVLNAPANYPYQNVYRPWPGPNSNTYVAWVLKQARASHDLDPRGIGRDYLGWLGVGLTTTRTGIQLESPIVGIKAGLNDGVEIHVLCFTLGLDVWTPALKTPFGRFGFSESS